MRKTSFCSDLHCFDCADRCDSLGVGEQILHPTPIGGKRVGMKDDPQRDAQTGQRRTGNLAEGAS